MRGIGTTAVTATKRPTAPGHDVVGANVYRREDGGNVVSKRARQRSSRDQFDRKFRSIHEVDTVKALHPATPLLIDEEALLWACADVITASG